MTAKTVTIESKFHSTSATLRPRNGQVSARQMKRAEAICCGMADCSCPITVASVDGVDVTGDPIDVGDWMFVPGPGGNWELYQL